MEDASVSLDPKPRTASLAHKSSFSSKQRHIDIQVQNTLRRLSSKQSQSKKKEATSPLAKTASKEESPAAARQPTILDITDLMSYTSGF